MGTIRRDFKGRWITPRRAALLALSLPAAWALAAIHPIEANQEKQAQQTDAAAAEASAFDKALNENLINSVTLGTPDDVAILLDKGADANIKDANLFPLLSVAAEREGEEGITIATALLDAGADINATNAVGESALHNAIIMKNAKMVWFLLGKGADFHLPTRDGRVPLDLAKKSGDKQIIGLIEKAIAIDEGRKEHARSGENLQKMLYNYAYYHCSLAYLRYYTGTVPDAAKNPALSEEQFEKREKKIQDTRAEMIQLFSLDGDGQAMLTEVGEKTRAAITKKLDAMISTKNRLRKGFGTQEDIEKRCAAIAGDWKVESLIKKEKEAAAGGGAGE